MENKSKFLRWALVIGIVVVLNLFFNYAISLFYKQPDYNSYFQQPQVVETITNKNDCLKVGGQWTENNLQYNDKTNPIPIDKLTGLKIIGYCNPYFTKQQEWNIAQETYQRNIFIILVVLGVISLILGAFIPNEIITLSFSWGGVLSLVIASMRYWSNADNLIKVLILAVALGVLVWLAIKKFGK